MYFFFLMMSFPCAFDVRSDETGYKAASSERTLVDENKKKHKGERVSKRVGI